MAIEIVLPRVDMDMEQGKLTHWFVKPGESVTKGQPLFEIETDKAAMEVEAPASGVLRRVTAEAGETLPIGTVIGWLYGADEPILDTPSAAAEGAALVMPPKAAPAAPPVAPPAHVSGVRATPKARRLAREAGLDIRRVVASGPNGRIQARDIPARASAAAAGLLHREWLARGERSPLVLIHGFGADLNGWRRWIAHLPAGRGALAVDLPGHGRSALSDPIEIGRFADAIAATLDAEGVEFAHVVAHSLGAAAAVFLAEKAPARVGSLTLIAPAGLGPDINGGFVDGFLRARSPAGLAPWLQELAVDPAALGSALPETTMRQRRDLGVGDSQARIAAALLPDGAQAFSVRAALAAYPGPIKVIFGLEDRILSPRHARRLPGAVGLHLLPNVGHMPHLEARDLVARLTSDNAAAGDERATRRNLAMESPRL